MNDSIIAFLDDPNELPENGYVHVRGWIASDQPISDLFTSLEVKKVIELEPRQDVAQAHPDKPHVCGFKSWIPVEQLSGNKIRLMGKSGDSPFSLELPIKNTKTTSLAPQALPISDYKKNRLKFLSTFLATPGGTPLSAESLKQSFNGSQYNFLSKEEADGLSMGDTHYVSAHSYPPEVIQLIECHQSGWILDCGAGLRNKEYANVINFEPVNFASTDVQGVCEQLPFKSNSFDAVISLAVLEHLKDPFMAAREMVRVLKPGGILHLEVPLLVQEHGYPNHYYNMTTNGLANLIENSCSITKQEVPQYGHPLHALLPIIDTWSKNLQEEDRKEFEELKLGELINSPEKFYQCSWAKNIPKHIQSEIAALTRLVAIKD